MKWELIIYCVKDDRTYTDSYVFLDFNEAKEEFLATLDDPNIIAAVVYSEINGYKPSIVLAYNNDWNDDFIHQPEWVS